MYSILEPFPIPSLPPSRIAPARLPGICPESTKVLLEVLRENHEKWHIFLNEKRFHNHASHHVLALWALGASANLIQAAYTEAAGSQRPAFPSPEPINSANFEEHLGDENYYQAFVQFFEQELAQKGFGPTLERYIFAVEANFSGYNDEAQPEMLSRFLANVLHPMIHVGHGMEFGLPGILAEGKG
ncbi:hypothetical protein HGRIS_014382 [Hohenbuehelia grisea]|uniref:Uncharacterized protein n=1 Tax=Hohenbuehelia grisea TaxID=104357 RepID=A0ABR3JTB9_9AGAR